VISSRTPEGPGIYCPVCGTHCRIEPAMLTRDATCPRCGSLLWFGQITWPGLMPRFQLTPESRLLEEIAEQPERPEPYIELTEVYRQQGRLDAAERLLAQGLKAVPGDPSLRSVYADVQIARLQRAIVVWTRRSSENPGDDVAAKNLAGLTQLLSDYEIAEYRRRVALSPEDTELRHRLSDCLAKAGRHDEAAAGKLTRWAFWRKR
jgi:thioredoxin-like negative regulator of GroEL